MTNALIFLRNYEAYLVDMVSDMSLWEDDNPKLENAQKDLASVQHVRELLEYIEKGYDFFLPPFSP